MVWIFAIVIIILLVVSAGFRKFSGVILAVAVVAGLYFYFQNEHEKEASLSRISQSDLALDNLMLLPDFGSYKLTGRVTNRSPRYALSDFTLKISMQDCIGEPEKESCVTIGENSEYIYLQIPPGQARDLNESVYFSGGAPKAKGRLTWQYSVAEIHAKDAT